MGSLNADVSSAESTPKRNISASLLPHDNSSSDDSLPSNADLFFPMEKSSDPFSSATGFLDFLPRDNSIAAPATGTNSKLSPYGGGTMRPEFSFGIRPIAAAAATFFDDFADNIGG